MDTRLEVLLSPAEFETLRHRDLRGAVCVVLDILRATTSMVTALHAGARAIIPVTDIPEALALRRQHPEALLAGERNGLRISASQAGGTEFDLGNSPREFTPERVRGKTIVMTTTNGTRALRACAGAGAVLAGSFLNLRTVTDWLRRRSAPHLVVVCAGTQDEAAFEDTLAAGALCQALWAVYEKGQVADAAHIARLLYGQWQSRLLESMALARNGRRLLAHPELKDDVPFCLQRDILAVLPRLRPDGSMSVERGERGA